MATIDQQFVEFVVKALVSDPDSVEINRTIDEKGVLLELKVAQEDLGRVIGKRGNTAQSIRTLLRALGTKNDARYNLKIVDPEGDARRAERKQENEERAETQAPEASTNTNQWAHLSSSNDSDDEDVDNTTDESEESSTEAENNTVEKHKKDLADLDDIGL